MTEEVRRSGRATKGQHTKLDETETPTPKPRGKAGKAAKSKQPEPEEEEDAIIRCICGCVVEDQDDDRVMVICDKCSAWQHNICMGVSEIAEEIGDHYFCEQCKPQDHVELLAQIARGEKPWEARNEEARRREEEERKARKRGKKGKKGRKSEPQVVEKNKEVNGTPTSAPPPPPPEPLPVQVETTVPKPVTQPEPGQKRKLPTELDTPTANAGAEEHSSKIRKVSTPKESHHPPQRRKSTAVPTPVRHDSKEISLQTELVQDISELQNENRRKVASALVKLFVDQTQQAQKQGAFSLPPGQLAQEFGKSLGLQVEYAIYLNFWGHTDEPRSEYGEKLRMMLHNVKANTGLRDRLLSGSLSPNDFSKMSSNDMASKELQEKTAEMLKEAEKQHMLVKEEGPRIRRTHKGEEIVGDESQHLAGAETIFPNAPRPRDSIDASIPRQTSPDAMSPSSPNRVELPQDIIMSGMGASPTSGRPLVIDPKPVPKTSGSERKPSSTFNIQTVWSSVDSPSTDKPPTRTPISAVAPDRIPSLGVQTDAEIDKLLKDEDQEDEEPYSPTDMEAEPGTIWRGKVAMASVAEFRGTAKWVAGANLSHTYPWSQLAPPVFQIEGRIAVEKATQYLCGLQWSKSTDVSIIAITANDFPDDQAQFNKLFTYFTDRDRYGVISKNPVTAVRDMYVSPLEAGSAKKPEFIELLKDNIVEDNRPKRSLLITYVIKLSGDNNTPSAQATPRTFDGAGGGIASPISTQAPSHYRTASMGHTATTMSPIAPYTGAAFSTPPQQQGQFMPPQQQQAPYSPAYNTTNSGANTLLTGIDAARQVLGEMASAPVVAELLIKAPATGVTEFGIIKEVFESVPASRSDFKILMDSLTAKSRQ